MLKACHHGPAGSLVERVEPVEGGEAELAGAARFEVRRTA
jgi:acylphosphatase